MLEDQKSLLADEDGMVADYLRKAGAPHLLNDQLRQSLGSFSNAVVFGEAGEIAYRRSRETAPKGPEDIVEVSRVGLDAAGNRALLCFRYYGGDQSGGSMLLLFEKHDQVWKVTKTFLLWIA